MAEISVIVPVYNVQKYLSKLLKILKLLQLMMVQQMIQKKY